MASRIVRSSQSPFCRRPLRKRPGGAEDSVLDAGAEVFADAAAEGAVLEFVAETGDIERKLGGVAEEVLFAEGLLVFKEQGVHLPEFPLRAGGFGRFCCLLGVAVDAGERVVAEGDTQAGGKFRLQVSQQPVEGAAAGGALIVAGRRSLEKSAGCMGWVRARMR